jgi:flagellar basal-body rod protein FlgC
MSLDGLLKGLDLATSGLAAEQRRMNVIMENIANANVTRIDPNDPRSGPYVRRRVYFSQVLDREMNRASGRGVQAGLPVEDYGGEFPKVFDPGHADADEDGFVRRSNVNLVYEMLDLSSAKHAFEANLSTFKTWKDMASKSIEMMRM